MLLRFKSKMCYTKKSVNNWKIYGIRYSNYDRVDHYEVVRDGLIYANFDKQSDAVKWAESQNSEFRLTHIDTDEIVFVGYTLKVCIDWQKENKIDDYLLLVSEFKNDEYVGYTTFPDVVEDVEKGFIPETLSIYK